MSNTEALTQVAQGVRSAVGASTAAVVLGEEDNSIVFFAASVGQHAHLLQGRRGPAAGSGLCGSALEAGVPILAAQTIGDGRVHQEHATQFGIDTALAVPILEGGSPVAFLMALNRVDGGTFDEASQAALESYAARVTSEVARARGERDPAASADAGG